MGTLYRPLFATVNPSLLTGAGQLQGMIATGTVAVKANDVTFVEGIHAAADFSCGIPATHFDAMRNDVAAGRNPQARRALADAAGRLGELPSWKFKHHVRDAQERGFLVTGGRRGLEPRDADRDIGSEERVILERVVQGTVKWMGVAVPEDKISNFCRRVAELTGEFDASLVREDGAWRRGLPPFVFLGREDLLQIARPYLMSRLVAYREKLTASKGLGQLVGEELSYGAGKVVGVEQDQVNAGPFLKLRILGLNGKETEHTVPYPDQIWCYQPPEESDMWPHVPPLTTAEVGLAQAVQKAREVRNVPWTEILGPDTREMNRHFTMGALMDYGDRLRGPMHDELASVLVASGLSVFPLPTGYMHSNGRTGFRQNYDNLVERFIVGSHVHWLSWGEKPRLAFDRFAGRVLQANVYDLGQDLPHYSLQLYLMTAGGVVELMIDPWDFGANTFVLAHAELP